MTKRTLESRKMGIKGYGKIIGMGTKKMSGAATPFLNPVYAPAYTGKWEGRVMIHQDLMRPANPVRSYYLMLSSKSTIFLMSCSLLLKQTGLLMDKIGNSQS